jgi:N-acetylglutamate synthase-like GNAT family acetyltransferase
MSHFERQQGPYQVSTDPARLDVDAIHAYLVRSYWSEGIPKALVERSLSSSLCFGLYVTAGDGSAASERAAQVGFARIISDRATFAYLCDVYVLEEHRGRGLSKWLMESVLAHPELQGLRRFMLATRDAHGLYARFGFTPLARPQTFMEIARPGLYKSTIG